MPYLNRRQLMGTSLAAASMLLTSMKSQAVLLGDVQLRDQINDLERLPTLGLESRESYRTAFRKFVNTDLRKAADRRVEAIFREVGIDPRDDIPLAQVISVLEGDPILMGHLHAFLNVQQAMWHDLQQSFHMDADRYLEEMENASKSDSGLLELNPKMFIPDYARWEVHNQPGGYVGDPFAGHMYHYGTNNFFMFQDGEDHLHREVAQSVPLPSYGTVNRALDLGTSVGQTATSLKRRFPDAEVWGIDVGAPMVRYAHMRAVDLGLDVKFAQRLAEDTKFPDNHFDIATGFLLFHEVDMNATQQIIPEIFRVLKPGGTFVSHEASFMVNRPKRTAQSSWRIWWNDQWCAEVHYMPYASYDYAAAFKAAGFELGTTKGPFNREYIMARKPA